MIVPFDQLSPDSTLWFYQGNRMFTESEEAVIEQQLEAFCASWTAHQQPLKVGFCIRDHFLILLAVDESYNQVGGCSLDESFRLIKNLGNSFNMNLLDRTTIPFVINEALVFIALKDIPQTVEQGIIGAETMHYHTAAKTKAEFDHQPLISVRHSWISRYVSNIIEK